MSEDKNNDNEKVLRFDLPIKFCGAKLVARCKINPGRSDMERVAKSKRVYEQFERCAMQSARLLVEICEFANGPAEVAGLALTYVTDCATKASDIYERYMRAFGEAVEKKRSKRAAGESGSETGPARKKD